MASVSVIRNLTLLLGLNVSVVGSSCVDLLCIMAYSWLALSPAIIMNSMGIRWFFFKVSECVCLHSPFMFLFHRYLLCFLPLFFHSYLILLIPSYPLYDCGQFVFLVPR